MGYGPRTQPLSSLLPGPGQSAGVDLENEIMAGTTLGADYIAPDVVQTITVPLTSAQLLGMNATPVELIPAPGAGKVIIIDNVLFTMTRTSTAYASGGTIVLNYATGPVAAINTIAASVLTTAGAAVTQTVRDGIDAAAVANDAIVITNGSGAFTTGTGTASVNIKYRIVTFVTP